MGNRDDIDEMSSGSIMKFSRFLLFINNNLNFNNYEQLMIYIFYLGVFINPALVEPFGLTLIKVGFN